MKFWPESKSKLQLNKPIFEKAKLKENLKKLETPPSLASELQSPSKSPLKPRMVEVESTNITTDRTMNIPTLTQALNQNINKLKKIKENRNDLNKDTLLNNPYEELKLEQILKTQPKENDKEFPSFMEQSANMSYNLAKIKQQHKEKVKEK